MNKVILMGRLTRDPEVRYSQGATPMAVARFSLAVDRRFRRNSGDDQQTADFINCVAFGKNGEFIEKYFRKGQMVGVVGRLQVSQWTDNTGSKRYSTDVVVEEQYFAESKGNSENRGSSQSFSQDSPAASFERPSAPMNKPSASEGFYPIDESIEDDDLPF